MKPKANGVKCVRLNTYGYDQVDGLHYNSQDLLAPVVNNMTVRIVVILIIMASCVSELLDAQGAFLNNRFQNGEQLFMHVPQGIAKFYPPDVLLLLLQIIDGLKQAAMQFWRALLAAMTDMGFKRIKAEPCLYFK
eukprot:12754694-Ditylum_brightwellii.AAC.1